MTEAEHFERLAELFHRVVDLPETERQQLLEPLRRQDPSLVAEVDRLLSREASRSDPAKLLVPAEPPPRERSSGARIGPYRLVERVGSGGMGEVYRAARADGQYAQTVAIKVVRAGSSNPDLLERFRFERQILARLEHPSIARLVDGAVGPDGLPYLAMEYVEGRPITEFCDAERWTIDQRLALFRTVCRAVQFAHRNLVIHRDLKPSNILVTAEGEAKLLDFGIAKLLAPIEGAAAPSTRTIAPLMTPDYASPEQVRGEAITTATDVYALGLLLYELLCGKRAQTPGDGSLLAIERSVCAQDPPRPSDALSEGTEEQVAARVAARGEQRLERLRRRLQGDLDTIVATALRKDPARRYVSAAELAADIERHSSGLPVVARPDTLRYRTGKFLRRHKLGLAAAAAVALAIVGGLALALLGLVRAQRAERRALEQAATASQIADYLVELFRVNDPGESQGSSVTARELLDRGAERMRERLDTQPAVRTRLLRTMARAYESLGLFDPAQQLVEESLELARSTYGEGSREVGRALVDLAGVYGRKGEYERSLEAASRGLEILERVVGPEDQDLTDALNRVGMAHGRLGDLERARIALERALAIEERSVGPDHRDLWSPLNNLAIVHWSAGETEAARELYERALFIAEREFGAEHPALAHTLNNLALVHQQTGEYDAAIELLERVLAIREKVLDPDHPDIAESLNNLGSAWLERQDFVRAKEMSERALAIRERVLGPEHDHVATTQCNLAFALLGLGDADAARPLFERSLAVFERTFGAEGSAVSFPLLGLARIDRDRGALDAADARYRRAIAIRETLGERHPDLVHALEEYAAFLRLRGREEQAAALEGRVERTRTALARSAP